MGLVFFEPYEYYQVFYVCMFYLLAIHQFLYTPRQWLLAPSVSRFQLDSVYPSVSIHVSPKVLLPCFFFSLDLLFCANITNNKYN